MLNIKKNITEKEFPQYDFWCDYLSALFWQNIFGMLYKHKACQLSVVSCAALNSEH